MGRREENHLDGASSEGLMPAGITTVVASSQGFLPEDPAPQPTMTHPAELRQPA
jgi:hypothetical protein